MVEFEDEWKKRYELSQRQELNSYLFFHSSSNSTMFIPRIYIIPEDSQPSPFNSWKGGSTGDYTWQRPGRKQETHFGHVIFVMPRRHLNEDVKQAVGYIHQEHREEVGLR